MISEVVIKTDNVEVAKEVMAAEASRMKVTTAATYFVLGILTTVFVGPKVRDLVRNFRSTAPAITPTPGVDN